MKKKLLLVFMSLALVLSMVSCSGGETDQAKKTVETFLTGVKNSDPKKINEALVKKDRSEDESVE